MIYIDNGTFITKYEFLNPKIEESIEFILRSISEDVRSERYSKTENLSEFELDPNFHKEKFSTLVSEAMSERTKL